MSIPTAPSLSTELIKPTEPADWWRGAVIYQIYPRSFKDSNDDGVGDLPGIIGQLDYVAALNVDAIWISPFFKSPMKDFGYDVSDYRAVDPLFGTLEDFEQLISAAHARGIKVIIDQVISHTSDQHVWFQESRSSRDNAKADWYIWADPKADGSPPNNWLSIFGGSAWQWESRRRQYYLHNFLSSQPDLNFHEEAVQRQILDDVEFWCRLGLDGFRFDACNFHFHDQSLRDNPPAAAGAVSSSVRADNPYSMQQHCFDKNRPENLAFLERLRGVLDRYGAIGLGEIGDEDAPPLMASYTAGNERLHMAYSFGLLTPIFSASHIRMQGEQLETSIGPTGGWACWSLSNHDVPRVLSRWGGDDADPRLAKLLLCLLGSLRGTVCLFQGEELGLPEAEVPYADIRDPYGIAFWPEYKGRDGCRTPFPWSSAAPHGGFSDAKPWLPIASTQLPRAVNIAQQDENSILHFYRRFLAWRAHQTVLKIGSIYFFDTPEPVLMHVRSVENAIVKSAMLCVFNLSAERISVPVIAALTTAFPTFRRTDLTTLTGHGLTGARFDQNNLILAPYGGLFAQLTLSSKST
ncbi:MAG: alpha-amylase family glycosyl hydrolase [Pseudomonadota bacterium]